MTTVILANKTKFKLGPIYSTPGAIEAVTDSGETIFPFVLRHASGDWGEVCDEDRAENELSLKEGYRILSAYRTKNGVRLWVITEADRSATTVLLPEEY